MDIPFSSDKICPPVLGAPPDMTVDLYFLRAWGRRKLLSVNIACAETGQQFVSGKAGAVAAELTHCDASKKAPSPGVVKKE